MLTKYLESGDTCDKEYAIKCQEKIDEYTKKQNQSECTTEDQSPNTAFASTTINCAGHMASRQ